MTLVEGCVQAEFATDESAWGQVIITAGDQVASLDLGAMGHQVRLADAPSGSAGRCGCSGRRARHGSSRQQRGFCRGRAAPAAQAARLVITEVLANPAGSEYTQEFVELENLEAEPVSLAGMLIEDKTGSDVLPDVAVPAGGFALIVAASFVADDGKDPVPRDGTVIVSVSGRNRSRCLSNSGEPVRLVSSDGAVVSQYGGWVDVSATAWNGMSVHRISVDACDQPSAWTNSPEMPTPGW